MAPRLSGGSLTPWLPVSRVERRRACVRPGKRLRIRLPCTRRSEPDCPDDLVPFVRGDLAVNCDSYWMLCMVECCRRLRSGSRRTPCSRARARDDDHPSHCRCAGHHAIDTRSALGTVQGSALRSDRARARPAGLDGACAQIAFLAITRWPAVMNGRLFSSWVRHNVSRAWSSDDIFSC